MNDRITLEQAAEIMNTSVEYVHQLVALGRFETFPTVSVGAGVKNVELHVLENDVRAYKEKDDKARRAVADELTRISQEDEEQFLVSRQDAEAYRRISDQIDGHAKDIAGMFQ